MKRIRTIALGLALCSALSACSRFVPSSYTRVSAHSQTKSEQVDTNVVSDKNEGELLKNAIDFSEQQAQDILIHRVDLAALPITASKEEVAALFTETKHLCCR